MSRMLRVSAVAIGMAIASACAPDAGERATVEPGADARAGSASRTTTDAPRVVSLVPSLTELVIALGAGDRLVARTDYDRQPELAHLPSVGGGLDPNFETLVGVGADVVLVAATRDAPALSERLTSLSIDARSFEIQTIDQMYRSTGLLGELLGRAEAADSLVASVSVALDEVRSRVAGRDPVPVFYVGWSDPPMTTGPGTFVDEVIRIAGGRNVFDDAPLEWPTVGFEAIVARAPEVILWPRGDVAEGALDRLRSTPGWREVEAVQEGRIELIDADTFNRPGPRVVLAARGLADVLHPDAR